MTFIRSRFFYQLNQTRQAFSPRIKNRLKFSQWDKCIIELFFLLEERNVSISPFPRIENVRCLILEISLISQNSVWITAWRQIDRNVLELWNFFHRDSLFCKFLNSQPIFSAIEDILKTLIWEDFIPFFARLYQTSSLLTENIWWNISLLSTCTCTEISQMIMQMRTSKNSQQKMLNIHWEEHVNRQEKLVIFMLKIANCQITSNLQLIK